MKRPNANRVSVYSNVLRSEKVSFHEEPFYCFDVKPPYRIGDILYVREKWHKYIKRVGKGKKSIIGLFDYILILCRRIWKWNKITSI